jgi:hypothetical protein
MLAGEISYCCCAWQASSCRVCTCCNGLVCCCGILTVKCSQAAVSNACSCNLGLPIFSSVAMVPQQQPSLLLQQQRHCDTNRHTYCCKLIAGETAGLTPSTADMVLFGMYQLHLLCYAAAQLEKRGSAGETQELLQQDGPASCLGGASSRHCMSSTTGIVR